MKRLPIVFVVASMLVLAGATSAFAAVVVTPSKIEITLAPGAQGSFDIAVIDKGGAPLNVKAAAWDFARDENGRARPVTTAEAAMFYGCASWLEATEATLVAEPGKKATIHVKVRAPAGVKVGTYHCYVRALAQPQEGEGAGGLPISYDFSALVLLTVAPRGSVGVPISDVPQLKRAAKVLPPDVRRFVFTSPVSLRATLVNTGNVHVNVKGHFEVLNAGHRVARLPTHVFTLLPGDRYPVKDDWSQTPVFGRMTARFVMEEGLEKPATAEQPFIFISSVALIAAGSSLGVVLAGASGVLAWFKYRPAGRHSKRAFKSGRHARGAWSPEQTT